jgi:hypothetical protein
MRLPCASTKIQIEDSEDNSSRIGPEAMMRQNFSSAPAIVAQEAHSFQRGFLTWQKSRIKEGKMARTRRLRDENFGTKKNAPNFFEAFGKNRRT